MDLSRRDCLRLSALGAAGLAGCASNMQPPPTGPQVGDGPGEAPPTASTPSERPTPTEHPLPTPEDPCSANPAIEDDDPLTVAVDAREQLKCTGRAFDTFETLEAWTASAGTLSPATEQVYSGSQSARLDVAPGEYRGRIYRRFPGGVDLSGHDLSIAMKLDAPVAESVFVRLDAPDRENSLLMGRHVWRAGWMRLDLGPLRRRGSPDLGDVREIGVHVNAGTGTAARVFLDSLRVRPRAGPGRVVLTFDNNLLSQYEVAFPVLRERGFRGVVGVRPGTTEWDGRISLPQLRELRDAGWDVVSAPRQDGGFRALGPDRQAARIRESKQWLVDNGFGASGDVIVWPASRYDASSLRAASRYHHLGFARGLTPVGTVSEPLLLGRLKGEDVEAVERAVDFAAEYGLLLSLAYGGVGNSRFGMSRAEFVETMDYVADSDLEAVTATELWQSLQ